MKPVWDPEIVSRASRLQLRARELVWGIRLGAHPSTRVSKGTEFVDTKEYTPGDPIRDIDWRVVARSDRLVIRRQVAETELSAMLVLDASADMHARSSVAEESAFDRSITLVACLALLLQRRGNRVGLLVLGGSGLQESYLPARRSSSHLSQIMTTLSAVKPSGRASLTEGFSFCAQHLKSRSLCFVFSDLMEESERWAAALSAMSVRKMDVRFSHVFSKKEFELDFKDPLQLFSKEDLGQLPIDPDAIRDAFLAICSDYRSDLLNIFSLSRCLYVPCPLEESPNEALFRLLKGV